MTMPHTSPQRGKRSCLESTTGARPAAPLATYFGGLLLRQVTTPGVTASHVSYDRRRCAPHSHRHAFVALVTAGGYSEHWGTRSLVLEAAGVAHHPAGITHADDIAADGTCVFVVEAHGDLGDALNDRELGRPAGDVSAPRALGPEAAGRLATLLASMRHSAEIEPLPTESLAAEAFATAAAVPRTARGPAWVSRVLEMLDGVVDRPLTLRDVAREVGLHPVYLSRAFRAATGVGLAEARRRARVSRAIAFLTSGRPAAEVAVECGFADQSHLCKAVRKVSNTTPAFWRALGRPEPSSRRAAVDG
jgi:AraC family transcriptional regulator